MNGSTTTAARRGSVGKGGQARKDSKISRLKHIGLLPMCLGELQRRGAHDPARCSVLLGAWGSFQLREDQSSMSQVLFSV